MKKFIIANAIGIILMSVFLVGFTASFELPVYADSTTDEWLNVTTNEQLAEAFRYYCKSRDLTIDGSLADGITKFTTNSFNGICKTLGIDITALQAEIKYKTDGNAGLRFLFTATGVNAYNRIFAQFLQDNNLSVGDSIPENSPLTLYSGRLFTDWNDYSCLAYEAPSNVSYSQINGLTTFTTGTVYRWDGEYFNQTRETHEYYPYDNGTQRSFTITYYAKDNYGNDNAVQIIKSNMFYIIYGKRNSINYKNGSVIVVYCSNNGRYYVGAYSVREDGTTTISIDNEQNRIIPKTSQSCDVYVTTNNTVINNNNYEGDTIINNEGDVTNNTNNNYNPYPDGGGTITPPGNTGGNGTDGTINFPDFNINLPEINWSLGDLSNKFPFSIPFDMIAFLTLLNGEPQAPHITGSIPLSSQITWELDLDFAPFDDFASIMRGLEFVGFMFFLISATINIVRG